MTTKQPATPLPWAQVSERANEGMGAPVDTELRGSNRQVAVRLGRLYNESQKQDAAYIAHACNAYPELVAALHSCAARLHQETDGDAWTLHAQARALLAKLGED